MDDHYRKMRAMNILERDHRGKDKCMKRKKMAQFLFNSSEDWAVRETRQIMSDLAREYPVTYSVASNGGYYYIESTEELEQSMRTIESQALKMLQLCEQRIICN